MTVATFTVPAPSLVLIQGVLRVAMERGRGVVGIGAGLVARGASTVASTWHGRAGGDVAMVSHQPLGPESVAAERAASADPVAVVDSVDEELLGVRVLRQVRTGLDVERLLPSAAKRESDVRKRLAKMAERAGFYIFVAAQAHAVGAGRAPARRNAELMLVREIARWREDVERDAPDCLASFDALVLDACEHPAPLPNKAE